MERLLTPQQELFLAEYTNPKSPNFGNAYQSALKAKYSEEYAKTITSKDLDWLSDNVGVLKRLKKAEKILDKTLDMEAVDSEGKIDVALLRVQTDVAKVVVTTLGKALYSTRNELTGANGEQITLNIVNYDRTDDTIQLPTEELSS